MKMVQYFSKAQLVAANQYAIRRGANMTLTPAVLARVPDDVAIPIARSFLHGDEGDVRLLLVMDAEGHQAFLDLPASYLSSLPTVEVEEGA